MDAVLVQEGVNETPAVADGGSLDRPGRASVERASPVSPTTAEVIGELEELSGVTQALRDFPTMPVWRTRKHDAPPPGLLGDAACPPFELRNWEILDTSPARHHYPSAGPAATRGTTLRSRSHDPPLQRLLHPGHTIRRLWEIIYTLLLYVPPETRLTERQDLHVCVTFV